jgi:hypothetical protein
MAVNAASGNKQGRPENEDNPTTVVTARMKATQQKVKDKNKMATQKQQY